MSQNLISQSHPKLLAFGPNSLQITWHLRCNLVITEKRPLLILLLEYGEYWLRRRVRDRKLQKLHSN